MNEPTLLTKPLFDALRAAAAERELVLLHCRSQVSDANQTMRAALIEAGLDPAQNYTLDKATLTATLVKD